MRTVLGSMAAAVALAGGTVAGTATTASAAPPQRETITFAETFHDDFLSDACGVDVTTTESGRITFVAFPDRPVGLAEVVSIHIDLVAVAGDSSVRFKNLGMDQIRVEPDGTVVLTSTGIAPFRFTGVIKIDLTTGEVIQEPRHTLDTTQVCQTLTR